MISHINEYLVHGVSELLSRFLSLLDKLLLDSWVEGLHLPFVGIAVPTHIVLALGASIDSYVLVELLIE